MVRRFLAHRHEDVPRIMRLIGLIGDAAPGHGPVQLLLGFLWNEESWAWERPGLPVLSLLASTFVLLFLKGGITVFLSVEEGFSGSVQAVWVAIVGVPVVGVACGRSMDRRVL